MQSRWFWPVVSVAIAACGSGSSAKPPSSETAGSSGSASDTSSLKDAGVAIDSGATGGVGANAGSRGDADAGGICTYDPSVGPTPGCMLGAPSACPTSVPSFSKDVAPAITTYCVPCHNTRGLAPDKPFNTYAEVFKTRTTVLGRVSGCVMPPACAAQPTTEARNDILNWLICDAPNN